MCVNPFGETGTFYDRDYCGGESIAAVYPAMDLAFIAALIRSQGHTVDMFDANALRLKRHHIISRLKKFRPDLVCLSTTVPSFKEDIELAKESKAAHVCKFIFIGNYPTTSPENILSTAPWIDFLIRGEPEYTIAKLVEALESGGRWEAVKGISYIDHTGSIITGQTGDPVDDLDSLPMPAHDLLPIKSYFSPHVKKLPMTCLITSRGCPYRCLFCTAPTLSQGRWRSRSPGKVLEEIRVIVNLGIREIFIRDETFTIDRKRVRGICERIIQNGIKVNWYCFSRVDTIDRDTLNVMKRAGCHLIIYGIESGSQTVLDLNRKGITTEQSREAVRLTKECGIQVGASIMIGMYGDTRERIKETIKFTCEIDPNKAAFTMAIPFPDTEFYSVATKEGLLKEPNIRSFHYLGNSSLSLAGLSGNELRRWLIIAYFRYYMRPKQILRELAALTSPRKAYFLVRSGFYLLRKLASGK